METTELPGEARVAPLLPPSQQQQQQQRQWQRQRRRLTHLLRVTTAAAPLSSPAVAAPSSTPATDPTAAGAPACPTGGTYQELRARFQLEEGYTQLNHGSFGCCPTEVADVQVQLLRRAEQNPDKWIGHHGLELSYHPLLNAGRAKLAEYCNADLNDLVLVENASVGMNSVLRGQPWAPGDKLLCLDTAYGMVKNVLAHLVRERGVEVVEVSLAADSAWGQTGHVTAAAVMDAVKRTVSEHGGPGAFRMACVSHITAYPAALMPVQAFCAYLSPHGCAVVVDGAHAIGQIAIDLPALGCAAYTANLHKWFFTPKGTAFLWVRAQCVCSGVLGLDLASSSHT